MAATMHVWTKVACLLGLVACGRTPATIETPPPVIPTVIATSTEATTPVDATQIAAFNFETCPYSNRNDTGQIGYRGVYAGQTTSDELFVMYGDADEYEAPAGGEPGLVWRYPTTLGAWITVQSTVVTQIDHQHDDTSVSVKDILEEFGCPDLILSHDVSPHMTGGGFIAYLVYSQRGAQFLTQNFPTYLTDIVYWDVYFVPTSPLAYLTDEYGETLPPYAELVGWDAAFKAGVPPGN